MASDGTMSQIAPPRGGLAAGASRGAGGDTGDVSGDSVANAVDTASGKGAAGSSSGSGTASVGADDVATVGVAGAGPAGASGAGLVGVSGAGSVGVSGAGSVGASGAAPVGGIRGASVTVCGASAGATSGLASPAKVPIRAHMVASSASVSLIAGPPAITSAMYCSSVENISAAMAGSHSSNGVLKKAQASGLRPGFSSGVKGLLSRRRPAPKPTAAAASECAMNAAARDRGTGTAEDGSHGLRGAWVGRKLPGLGRPEVGGRCRRGRTPQAAGEGDAAGHDRAHRTAKPAHEARTNPLVGLGGKAGGEERCWHGGNFVVGGRLRSMGAAGKSRK